MLDGINLKVEEGEFVAILGFSGSGKTTLISAIAGLIEPDRGGVILRGREIAGPGPERGVVFQSYSLMPWLTVEGNVALAVDAVFTRETEAEAPGAASTATSTMVGLAPRRTAQPGASSPAACASASPSPGRSRCSPKCCCSTSRSRRSTR